ncbi:MAG: BlaI/MecI/CopY family transcriptional regulator [Nesterenkonia sp.]
MTRSRRRGELEQAVLSVLWEAQAELSATEVQRRLHGRSVSYSAVITILSRLADKEIVGRHEISPRKVRFFAAQTPEVYSSSRMLDELQASPDREAVLMKFAGSLREDEVDVLRRTIR